MQSKAGINQDVMMDVLCKLFVSVRRRRSAIKKDVLFVTRGRI
jgi:hypothetical protein